MNVYIRYIHSCVDMCVYYIYIYICTHHIVKGNVFVFIGCSFVVLFSLFVVFVKYWFVSGLGSGREALDRRGPLFRGPLHGKFICPYLAFCCKMFIYIRLNRNI